MVQTAGVVTTLRDTLAFAFAFRVPLPSS